MSVLRVATVAGRRLSDGYWTVTVAAVVSEPPVVTPDALDSAADPPAPSDEAGSTWFVEIGVVGRVDGGLAALATPAVVPAPPAVSGAWQPVDGTGQPGRDDPLLATVDGFVRSLLTGGEGDPARYASPDFDGVAVDPAPFVETTVERLTVPRPARPSVWPGAFVEATTPGGVRLTLSYELALAERAGRWEVTGFSWTPSPESTPDIATNRRHEGAEH